MTKDKYVLISDFTVEEMPFGGGEINDHELQKLFSDRFEDFIIKKSTDITTNFIEENKKSNWILSSYFQANSEYINVICNLKNFIIYEHDHKYVRNRNPAAFKNFLAPKNMLFNVGMYKEAKSILCQTRFHKEIMKQNLGLDNIINLSGNLWPERLLTLIEELSENREKEHDAAIMNYTSIDHKNTQGAIKYCNDNGLSFNLLSGPPEDLLKGMSICTNFVFFPKTPETFSRTCAEARMMNLKIISNNNIGVVHEPWFKENKGKNLINFLRKKRENIYDIVKGCFE